MVGEVALPLLLDRDRGEAVHGRPILRGLRLGTEDGGHPAWCQRGGMPPILGKQGMQVAAASSASESEPKSSGVQ